MVGLLRWGVVAWFAAVSLAGCGPAVDAPRCADSSTPEITYPDGLDHDLIAAATDHADERTCQ